MLEYLYDIENLCFQIECFSGSS